MTEYNFDESVPGESFASWHELVSSVDECLEAGSELDLDAVSYPMLRQVGFVDKSTGKTWRLGLVAARSSIVGDDPYREALIRLFKYEESRQILASLLSKGSDYMMSNLPQSEA